MKLSAEMGQDQIDPVNGNQMLPLRWITRVALDEATTQAIDVPSYSVAHTQVVAFVDIPAGVVTDLESERALKIRVDRYRRNGTGSFQVVAQSWNSSWTGWGEVDGGGANQQIPIRIRDANGADGSESSSSSFTPLEGWGGFWACVWSCWQSVGRMPNFLTLKDDYVPNPEILIGLSSRGATPNAWELEFTYPSHHMSILGVRLERENPSGAFVTLDQQLPTATGSCPSQPATARVMVADPEARARGVNVVFKLVNTGTGGCPSRVVDNDVQITLGSLKAYDANGAMLSSPPTFTVSVGS